MSLDIEQRIADIAASAGDPEAAHVLEDGLLADALHAIAEGVEHPQDVARRALAVLDLDFPRWYA